MKNINNFNEFLNESSIKWTKEKLQAEADKHKTKKDFKENNSSAYEYAKKDGLLDDLFKNHVNKGYSENKSSDEHWTKEKLQKEANKHKTKKDFKENNSSAYEAAKKSGLLDELFN